MVLYYPFYYLGVSILLFCPGLVVSPVLLSLYTEHFNILTEMTRNTEETGQQESRGGHYT